jgi:hypothetical protein
MRTVELIDRVDGRRRTCASTPLSTVVLDDQAMIDGGVARVPAG